MISVKKCHYETLGQGVISKDLFQSSQSQLIISAKAVHGQQASQTQVPEVRKMSVPHSSHFKIYL